MAALVVEHHAGTLLPEPAGDGEPDLVAAAPAVGEHDNRRIGTAAFEVPDGQLRPVRRPHDGVVRTLDALAPPESEKAVIELVAAGTARRQTLVGHPGDTDRGQRRTREHQAPPSPPPSAAAPPGPARGTAVGS